MRALRRTGSARALAVAAAMLLEPGALVVSVHGQAPPTLTPAPARADEENPYEGRPIREIRFEGLKRVGEAYVRNQLRSAAGQPLSWRMVGEDLRRLERLGEFRDIQADLLVDADLNVVVVFRVVEAPIVKDVLVVGNRQLSDQDIQQVVASNISLIRGIPIDDYQIGRAQRAIEELYRNKGYYLVQVAVDESELESQGNVIFRVREGERVKVTAIRFEGNHSVPARQLRTVIKTREAWLFDRGAIDDAVLDADAAAIVRFYLDRGNLDARASRRIQPSPDGKEAIITFLVEEGPVYTLREVSIAREEREEDRAGGAPPVFSEAQVRSLIELKAGDTFSQAAVDRSVRAVRDAYYKLGYVDAQATALPWRVPDTTLVDLQILIAEGARYRAGAVIVQGNDLTQQKVIRRQVQIRPDRWLDATAVEETQKRLRESGLFNRERVKATIQPEDPAEPGVRDVLVEVEEADTGSLSFGVAVGSDAGLSGVVNLTQRNFDLADFPDSFDEFIRGRAFRGAGQTFSLTAQPGTEVSTYQVSLLEPSLLDTPNSLFSSLYFRNRQFSEYDEDRLGTRWRLGRRFGERWTGGLTLRAEHIDIHDIDSDAAADFFAVEGSSVITGIGGELSRSTADNRFRPTRGTYTEVAVEQVGAMGGDYDFTRLTGEHQVYVPIDEDYFGNKTVVSLRVRAGYIPQDNEAPVFERFHLGGRSFRGFRFRGIGPIGRRPDGSPSNDHVGGEWTFFAGAEVERPVYREMLAVVVFVDSGTVENAVTLSHYRVSVGAGLRLYIPQFGNAPLAFDFGFPIARQDGDEERVFSFSIDLPFR